MFCRIVGITAKCKVKGYKFILLLQYQLMILNITAVKGYCCYLFGGSSNSLSCFYFERSKIMELKEFVMEIAKGIEARLEGVKVTPTETMKNNGVIQNGVSFRKDDEKISPVLYLDLWFKKFNKGELTLPDVVMRVISDYQELPPRNIPDFEEWISDVDLLDKISIHLVNKKANERMIATRKLMSYEIPETDLIIIYDFDN